MTWNSAFGPACCDTELWLCICESNIQIGIEQDQAPEIDPDEPVIRTYLFDCGVVCDQVPTPVEAEVTFGTDGIHTIILSVCGSSSQPETFSVRHTACDGPKPITIPLVGTFDVSLGNAHDACFCGGGTQPCVIDPQIPFFGSWDGSITDQNPTWRHFTPGFPPPEITPEEHSPSDPPVLREWIGNGYDLYSSNQSVGHGPVTVRSGRMTPVTSDGVVTCEWTAWHDLFVPAFEYFDLVTFAGPPQTVVIHAHKHRFGLNRFELYIQGILELSVPMSLTTPYNHKLRYDQTTQELRWSVDGAVEHTQILAGQRLDCEPYLFQASATGSLHGLFHECTYTNCRMISN